MSTRTAVVTGASRGFGRATAIALINAGVHVIGVARDRERLDALRDEAGAEFTPVAADAADPVTAGRLVDTYRPNILVLNAGAHPLLRPLHKYSWETFSSNWEVDVRHVFNWTREALLAPLDPGSVVVTVSSGAALQGSSIGGSYSGAKATILFITGFAAEESDREKLGYRTCPARRSFARPLPAAPRSHTDPRASRSGNRRPGNWQRIRFRRLPCHGQRTYTRRLTHHPTEHNQRIVASSGGQQVSRAGSRTSTAAINPRPAHITIYGWSTSEAPPLTA